MLNRTIVRLAIPIAIGALALTACGSEDGDDNGGGGGGSATYKIAYQGPLSGDNVALGENMQNGIQLAIDEANESGDYDFTVEYVPTDDEGDPGKATAAAQRAIDDSAVMAVIGPAFSGAASTAAPLYGEAGMAAVSSSATNPTLTEQEFPTFLRAVPNDSAQGAGMATYLAAQDGVETVIVIDDVSDYGVGLAEVAEQGLLDAGLNVERESIPADTPDYSGAARTVVQSGADALIYAGYYEAAGRFAPALADAGYDGLAMAGDGVNDDNFLNQAGNSAEGWLLTCPCTDPTEEEATSAFAERYQAEFNTPPGTYSAESYDVAMMIISTMAELGDDVNRESLYEALASTEYQGLTKTFSFDEKGEFTNQAIFLYEVQGSSREYLGGVEELTGS
ncbi:branched-chain amino acid ABC transporter substrate-binding protein [Streptomyces sodiiphilus]|uniref:Branched-chain amino acid ABC transporter substrate-binding protein n=1 Tax=Streptomyces sodiiphilus TaxID=226217 RepID=A0ABN2PE64_9ACTN